MSVRLSICPMLALVFVGASLAADGEVAPAVSAGNQFSLFLKADGTVWAVGKNGRGQLGDGTTIDRKIPTLVMHGVTAVSAGYEHSLFLKWDGSVWASGENLAGQLGNGTWTQSSTPVKVTDMTSAKMVIAGQYQSLFVKTDGTAWGCGLNNKGELGRPSSSGFNIPIEILGDVQSASVGYEHSLFLKRDGTVWGCGNRIGYLNGDFSYYVYSPELVRSGIKAISSSSYESLFLQTDGSVLGRGISFSHGVNPIMLAGVESISAGSSSYFQVKSDGSAWASGANSAGQFGIPSPTSSNSSIEVMQGVRSVSAGGGHTLFLMNDNTVRGSGSRSGLGTSVNVTTAIEIMSLKGDPRLTWLQGHFNDDEISDPLVSAWNADPDNDGIPNLIERAFNLSPSKSATTILTADTGAGGLPLIRTATVAAEDSEDSSTVLSVQYIRLKSSGDSGVDYTVQIGSTLDFDAWHTAEGTEIVEPIDANWERVTLREEIDLRTGPRFARVKVTAD